MTTFAISTLGCKVNTYESMAYLERLKSLGYQEVDFKEKADIYLINTCAVTNTAASKSRQKIHAAHTLNPDAYIAVIGCYSQIQSESVMQIEGVRVVVGSAHKRLFLEELPHLYEHKLKKNYVTDNQALSEFEGLEIKQFEKHTRAYLKVEDGCNQFCSYCVIPYARGRERSEHPDRVIQIAKQFVQNGHYEIVLSGIHTGRYGKEHGLTLADLIKRMLDEVEGLERIRLSSIEMNEISDEFLELMKRDSRIARHLHIPIQSGSDHVLKLMNRPYNTEDFIKRIQYIREQIPGISISTDIIAGFPEETDEDHLITLENAKKIEFSFMHVFPYSKRDGTKAAHMKQIHGTIRKQRTNDLLALSEKQKQAYHEKFIGKIVEVLVEKYQNGSCFGHSSEYIPVHFKGSELLIGKCVRIKLSKCLSDQCFGELEVIS